MGASTATRAVDEAVEAPPAPASLNGWVPDASKFCYGLPGALEPMGDFDPAGFSADQPLSEIKRFREAEVTHGRLSMLADGGPAINQLNQVRETAPAFFELLALSIGIIETSRAQNGWTPPGEVKGLENRLRPDYYPGDIGFDPLGLKPTDAAEFA